MAEKGLALSYRKADEYLHAHVQEMRRPAPDASYEPSSKRQRTDGKQEADKGFSELERFDYRWLLPPFIEAALTSACASQPPPRV